MSKKQNLSVLLQGQALLRIVLIVGIDIGVNVLGLAFGLRVGMAIWNGTVLAGVLAIVLAYVTYIISSLIIVVLIDGFVPPLRDGTFTLSSPEMTAWLLHSSIANFPYRQIYRNHFDAGFSFLSQTFYWALHHRISISTQLAPDSHITDPRVTSVGPQTLFGEGSKVFAHFVEGDELSIASVRIGKNVTIGAESVICPGVIISDGAVIGAGAVVVKNTVIGPNEIWGGVPARKIGEKTTSPV